MSNLISYNNRTPKVDEGAYVNLHSIIIGRVIIDNRSSIWPGSILCAFDQEIHLHPEVLILNKVVILATDTHSVEIENGTLISQSTTLQGCKIGKSVLIGRGAKVSEGVTIGDGAILYPNTLVLPGEEIPPGSLVSEIPSKIVREVTEQETQAVQEQYQKLKKMAEEFGSYYNLSVEE
jgi:carbonic anhydrase/acetyltransferase-like protein (isoleucine patch superfamily)